MNIYYEKQVGGLCRKHALNAFFGYSKISTDDFERFQSAYDTEYKTKFNFDTSCSAFDIIASDQKNLISYILKKNNIYTRYYALNQLFQKNINEYIVNILIGDFFFVYDESHIYGIRKKDNIWYIVDSITGVRIFNISKLSEQKNIGFIIPVDIKTEFYNNIELIKNIIIPAHKEENIKEYLIKQNNSKNILGELEIPLGICMDILDFQYKIKNNINDDFLPINNHIINYEIFLSKFINGRYNDIDLILEYLPNIILSLLSLNKKKCRYIPC